MKMVRGTAGIAFGIRPPSAAPPSGSSGSAPTTPALVLPLDPRLPARDRLLDDCLVAEMFAERLGEHGRLTVERVERLRAKYRVGESVRTVHRVWVGGQRYLVSARMRTTDADVMFDEARRCERACSPVRGVWYERDMKTVFWTFPNDRCLVGLDALSTPLPLVRALYPGDLSIDVVGYNPERAAIAAVSRPDEAASGFLKLYAGGGLEPARRALLWLREAITGSGSPLRVPRLRAWDDRRHLLVVDAVAGVHLDAVPQDELVRAFTALGASLGHLHALPTEGSLCPLPPFTAFDADHLARAGDVVTWARPTLENLARRTVDLLVAHRPLVQDSVCVHGDVNTRNFLFAPAGDRPTVITDTAPADDQRSLATAVAWQATRAPSPDTRGWRPSHYDAGFIDFDVASHGPAAADIAAVLAWLRTRALTGESTHTREAELGAALRLGYEGVRPMPSDRELQWFLAAALLVERAQRAITRVRSAHLACLDSLVAAAHASAVEVTRG